MDAADDRGRAITRRQVLAGAAALAVPRRAGAAAARGGVLRMALSGAETCAAVLACAQHGYLTSIGADGAVAPGLAESWETDDARRWQFWLRRGMTFHSGRDVTAHHVADALRRHGAERPDVLGAIAAVQAAGDGVSVTLARPDAGLAERLADWRLPIAAPWDATRPSPSDGCGPFVPHGRPGGQAIRLERNPNHVAPPRLDGFEVSLVPEAAARWRALSEDRADVIDLRPDQVPADLGRTRLLSVPGRRHLRLGFDPAVAPFRCADLRLAIAWGIDREELVKGLLCGHGRPGNDHPFSEADPHRDVGLPLRARDPDRARFHLRRAGLDRIEIALARQGAAALSIGSAEGCADSLWTRRQVVAATWCDHSTLRKGRDTDSRLSAALQAAATATDVVSQRAALAAVQSRLWHDALLPVPVFCNHLALLGPRVGIPSTISGYAPLDGFRAPERWWIA